MKFRLETSGFFYKKSSVIELEKLGFVFNPPRADEFVSFNNQYTKQDGEVFIEIKDLPELIKFIKKYGEIVMDTDSIEIYDDYRE